MRNISTTGFFVAHIYFSIIVNIVRRTSYAV